jgi:hypothetical protein
MDGIIKTPLLGCNITIRLNAFRPKRRPPQDVLNVRLLAKALAVRNNYEKLL